MYLHLSLLIFTSLSTRCVLSAEIEHIMNANELFDQNLPSIRQMIRQLHFDPMKVPDIVNEDVGPAYLNLTNGIMYNLSNFTRQGNAVIAFYKGSRARLHTKIHLDEVKGKFDYLAWNTWLGSDSGAIDTVIKNITVQLDVGFTVNMEQILLHPETDIILVAKMKILDFQDVEIMVADSVISLLKNIVINVGVSWYKKHVIEISERTASILLADSVGIINQWIHNLSVEQIVNSIFKILNSSTKTIKRKN